MSIQTYLECDAPMCCMSTATLPGEKPHQQRARLRKSGWVLASQRYPNRPMKNDCGRLDFCPACWERIKRERDGAK